MSPRDEKRIWLTVEEILYPKLLESLRGHFRSQGGLEWERDIFPYLTKKQQECDPDLDSCDLSMVLYLYKRKYSDLVGKRLIGHFDVLIQVRNQFAHFTNKLPNSYIGIEKWLHSANCIFENIKLSDDESDNWKQTLVFVDESIRQQKHEATKVESASNRNFLSSVSGKFTSQSDAISNSLFVGVDELLDRSVTHSVMSIDSTYHGTNVSIAEIIHSFRPGICLVTRFENPDSYSFIESLLVACYRTFSDELIDEIECNLENLMYENSPRFIWSELCKWLEGSAERTEKRVYVLIEDFDNKSASFRMFIEYVLHDFPTCIYFILDSNEHVAIPMDPEIRNLVVQQLHLQYVNQYGCPLPFDLDYSIPEFNPILWLEVADCLSRTLRRNSRPLSLLDNRGQLRNWIRYVIYDLLPIEYTKSLQVVSKSNQSSAPMISNIEELSDLGLLTIKDSCYVHPSVRAIVLEGPKD